MNKWAKIPLRDVVKIVSKNYTAKYNWDNINYLDTGNITQNKIENIIKFTLDDKLPSRAKRIVEKNDVIYSTVRPNQKHFGILKNILDNMLVSTGFAVLRAKKEHAINDYIYYYLSKDDVTNTLHSIAEQSTSAYPSIRPDDILNLEINLPPLPTQRRIAGILSALDDKIENNRRICDTLEQIAQAVFKRWFVDFDFPCLPQDYRPSGQVNLTDEFKSVMTYKRVGGLPIPQEDKWFVYILLCDDGSFYKGITKDLYRRFYEHYIGQGADWTKVHKPVKVIHYEIFDSQDEAAKREKDLKTGFGRTWLHREYEKLQKECEGLPAPKTQFGQESGGLPAPKTKLRQAGQMIDSELGLIPEGWEVKKTKELFSYIIDNRGKTPPTTDNGRKLVENWHISGDVIFPDFDKGRSQKFVSEETYNKWFRKGHPIAWDILYSTVGTLNKVSFVPPDCDFCIAQNIVAFRVNYNLLSQFYFYNYMLSRHFIEQAHGRVIETVQASIKLADIYTMDILLPRIKEITHFDQIVKPIYFKIFNIYRTNNILQQTRDTLLPKLMSGEVEV